MVSICTFLVSRLKKIGQKMFHFLTLPGIILFFQMKLRGESDHHLSESGVTRQDKLGLAG